MNFRSTCGACYYCRNKMEHFCRNVSWATGGFAEYAVYKEGVFFYLPENVSLDHGALFKPVSVAVHAIDRSNIRSGNSVAISGPGPIGLPILELALIAGARKVLVSEQVAKKGQVAKKLKSIISNIVSLDDIENAFELHKKGKPIKILIKPLIIFLKIRSLSIVCSTAE